MHRTPSFMPLFSHLSSTRMVTGRNDSVLYNTGFTILSSSELVNRHLYFTVITRSHGSVSVLRTTVKVNGEWQNLTLSRR